MVICFFEDNAYRNFIPLTFLRPVYELRWGMFSFLERWVRVLNPSQVVLHVRSYLAPVMQERYPHFLVNPDGLSGDGAYCLLINGRLTLSDAVLRQIKKLGMSEWMITDGESVWAACLRTARLPVLDLKSGMPLSCDSFPRVHTYAPEEPGALVQYPWEMIATNEKQLLRDASLVDATAVDVPPNVYVMGSRQKVRAIGEVSLSPGVVLDVKEGPIVLDAGVEVLPGAFLQGPLFIGERSVVKPHAVLHHGSTIGPVCKVGGEIEASILQGFSNKQHEGFLGHAFLGEWVNLGAGTHNSDLKNNYGSVKVQLGDQIIDTGLTFMGLIAGDHTKTAIGTLLNTGTILGVFCNIFGAGFPPRYVPSFSWGGAQGLVTYDLEKALSVARVVMQRRNKHLSVAEEQAIREVFRLSAPERDWQEAE